MIRSLHTLRRLVLTEQHHYGPSFLVARFGSFEGNHDRIDRHLGGVRKERLPSENTNSSHPQGSLVQHKKGPQGHWKSVEYQGAAAHRSQFQRLAAFVEELELPTDDNLLPGSLPAASLLNEALCYFTSYKAAAWASKQKNMSNVPKECTEKLLDFLEYQHKTNEEAKGEWIQNCIVYGNSPCFALVSGIGFYLRPLKGTSSSMRVFGARKQRRSDMQLEETLGALKGATRVHRFITQLIEDSSCPKIDLDWNVFFTVLELWKNRCWFLGSPWNKNQLSPDNIQDAFEGVESAQKCIDIMSHQMEQMDSKLTTDQREASTTMLMGALANSGIHGAADKAMEVLQSFEERQLPHKSHMYNCTMLAFANEAKYNKAAVHRAQELWRHILASRARIKPDPAATTTLLTAYSNAIMPEEVEKMLVRFEESSASTGIKPTRIDYNIAISSWAKSNNPRATERALALFRRMLELFESGGNLSASPDKITYTALIDAFARNPNSGTEGLDQADYLLQRAESSDDPSVQPDAIMYRNYMSALLVRLGNQNKSYAKADIAYRIELLLHRMRKKSRKVPDSAASMWHNAGIYGTAIAAWSKTKSPQAPKHGLKLFQELKKEGHKQSSLRPDHSIFHSVLACLGTRLKGVDERTAFYIITQAREIVSEMQRNGFPVTTETMNLYLKVLISSAIPAAVQEAEKTLQSLEEALTVGQSQLVPDSFSYQIVLEGYSKVPGGAEHAERTLRKIISLSAERPSLMLNSAFFNIVMDAWSRSNRDDSVEQAARIMKEGENHGFQPTNYSYTTLMNALANSGREDAPEIAESLLGQMQSDFASGKNPHCKPTDAPISAVIKCWELSAKPEAPDRIDAIVERLKDLSNHQGYTNLDLNYSSLKHAILAWMKFTDIRPDAGDRATKYLELVDECSQAGKLEAHFALHCYNAVLVTIARSRDGEKAGKAYSVLKRMEQTQYLRSRDYHAVLSACNETGVLEEATREQKEEAFRIANVTFLEYLESKLKPDEDVYNDMFRAHTTLLDGDGSQQEREMLITTIFTNSPEKIQQSQKVRAALRPALSASKYEEIIKDADEKHLSQS